MSALSAISRLFRAAPSVGQAARLYIALVEQSRNPFFYLELGVPDSLDGRFDLILLHMSLVTNRLRRNNPELAQELIEVMLADMDRSLREMGVGDMGVGRRVQKMANALYGRMKAYETADDNALIDAISRNVYRGGPANAEHVKTLAAYLRSNYQQLEATTDSDLIEAQIKWAVI